ncbi:multidrug resistance efflux transporter family protein [Pyxidicoccus parkwayensis]|uniref:multidrug resistance efflux transporter family protein n=1 Tax=Pyxidicoccus parkwayensis TaxID=2813578 RepID=UPI001F5097D1|nr:multidrug resistance efflux transporter family protein [Pyxidicoccus parkwaysis]
MALGLLAAAFFSLSFVLNRSMSLSGGHWVWSASLRYATTILLLGGWLGLRRGRTWLLELARVFLTRPGFWLLAGSVGFGVFYGGICLAADHAPGWLVATTWQTTLLASPFVLRAFGLRVPLRGVLFMVLIFVGIVLANLHSWKSGLSVEEVLRGVLPVLVAAFAYPFGNQLLNAARNGTSARVTHVRSPVLEDAASCVLLMSLGSAPFWLVLVAVVSPPAPAASQVVQTLAVALSSGVIATTLFLRARNLARDAYSIAAVDATQAAEVVFALVGEVLMLGAPLPGVEVLVGLLLVTGGILGFTLGNSLPEEAEPGADTAREA